MVTQHLLLAALRNPQIDVYFRDRPYFKKSWQVSNSIFNPEDRNQINSVNAPPFDKQIDITLRFSFPSDTTPAFQSRQTWVYVVHEFPQPSQGLFSFWSDIEILRELPRQRQHPANETEAAPSSTLDMQQVFITSPSQWAASLLQRQGLDKERIAVVPHGVDNKLFRPLDRQSANDLERRSLTRARHGLQENDFVFTNVSGMFFNKGIDILASAFYQVARQHENAHLLLKGSDDLYHSMESFDHELSRVPQIERDFIKSRMHYFGYTLDNEGMADIYRASDVYISPYRAEGFNIPVLEAIASGLPVICTAGGPTEEFTNSDFCWTIKSEIGTPDVTNLDSPISLMPDKEHCAALMLAAVDDEHWRQHARACGPQWAQRYTWDIILQQYKEVFTNHLDRYPDLPPTLARSGLEDYTKQLFDAKRYQELITLADSSPPDSYNNNAGSIANLKLYAAISASLIREFEVADKLYMEAIDLQPQNPTIPYNRALMLANSGQRETAAHALREVAENFPDFQEAREGLQKLEIILSDNSDQTQADKT